MDFPVPSCQGCGLRAKPTFYDVSRAQLRTSGEQVANNLLPDAVRPHLRAFQPQDWPPKAANLALKMRANAPDSVRKPVVRNLFATCSQLGLAEIAKHGLKPQTAFLTQCRRVVVGASRSLGLN